MSQQLLFRLLLVSSLVPMHFSISLSERAMLLEPTLYVLKLHIKSNMTKLEFTYLLYNEVHFNLREPTELLVLQTRANYVFEPLLFLNHIYQVRLTQYQIGEYYCIERSSGKKFKAGHYSMFTTVLGQITETTPGIKYVLHRDRKTKRW